MTVTSIVTAGSPIARLSIPPGVRVLSLENRYDVVPRLDAAPNPDQPNHTTVTVDIQHHDVGRTHQMPSTYIPAAQALDRDTAASVASYRASASAFFSRGPGSSVHVFRVARQ